MSPKRPRSHILEDSSRNLLHSTFTQRGWVVWDLHPDYGEDLFVRIFIDGVATHYSFFVQAKATDHIEKYMSKDGEYFNFPIDVEHVKYWSQFWEPVILTVWDAKSDITYWEVIQDFLDTNPLGELKQKRIRVDIPIGNVLDEQGLQNIYERTTSRFERFERVYQGAYVLKDVLEELSTKVVYDIGSEMMTIEKPSGMMELIFFGKLGNALITKRPEIFSKMFRGVPLGSLLLLLVCLGILIGVIKDKVSYEEYPESNRAVFRFKNEILREPNS